MRGDGSDVLRIDRNPPFRLPIAALLLLFALAFGGIGATLTPRNLTGISVAGARAILLPFVAGLLAGAIALAFNRRETVIDRGRGVVTWRGRVGPWRRESSRPLAGPTRVELRLELGDEDNGTSYQVVLCGAESDIEVIRTGNVTRARREAERAAAFLGVELRDLSGRHFGMATVVRRPGEIGVPIGVRVMAGTEPVDLPPRPPDLRTVIEPDGPDAFALTLPRQGFTWPVLLVGLVSLALLVFVTLFAVGFLTLAFVQFRDPTPALVLLLPLGFVAVPLVGLPAGMAWFRQRVWVSPGGVRVKSLFGQRRIPAADLDEVRVEELRLGTVVLRTVILRTMTTETQFGTMLDRAECDYLAALIKLVVAKGAARSGSPVAPTYGT